MITDAGCKELGTDQRPAYYLQCPDASVAFSEEHSSFPESFLNVPVGTKLQLIPGHGCTTMNTHDQLYLVREGKIVNRIPITSRGRGRYYIMRAGGCELIPVQLRGRF